MPVKRSISKGSRASSNFESRASRPCRLQLLKSYRVSSSKIERMITERCIPMGRTLHHKGLGASKLSQCQDKLEPLLFKC